MNGKTAKLLRRYASKFQDNGNEKQLKRKWKSVPWKLRFDCRWILKTKLTLSRIYSA